MFGRLLWKLLRGNRGRLTVALVAVISGAAVISALLNLQLDVERKLTQEFRQLGPNLVVTPGQSGPASEDSPQTVGPTAGPPPLMSESRVMSQIASAPKQGLVAAAPYFYMVAESKDTPVVVAGTSLDQTPKLEPTWKVEGKWITSNDAAECLVGRNVAHQFGLSPGEQIELNYLQRSVRLRVAGVIDAGGAEDSQVFVDMDVAQRLAWGGGEDARIQLVQLSVSGTSADIGAYAAHLASSLPGYDVRPIRQVTEAEGNLLSRTRLLIVSMVVLILVLTALCVLATMAALAMERRADVGLMKALGGTISRIVGLFLAEVGVLGAVGGLIGCIVGVALAQWMGHRVFGTSIAPRWEIFPITIAMMVVVSMAGALPLRRLGKIKPAVILRGE